MGRVIHLNTKEQPNVPNTTWFNLDRYDGVLNWVSAWVLAITSILNSLGRGFVAPFFG